MANPDALRLAILTELREAAGLTQSDMAQRCGLNGKQARLTAGAWEMGRMTPSSRRRIHFSGYLWDDLGLRENPARFTEIWEMLCEEWGWDPLTDQEWHRLTNQPRPMSATSRVEATDTAVANSTPPPPPPFQAPNAPHHFVGRADLLDLLSEELTTTDGVRLVALVGMGGIGKTTLAIQIAHALRTHFPDGVLWAQTAISTPLDILQSWARAFGYDYSELHDVESCAAALRSVVAPRQLLYVLDNVESVQRVRPLLIGGEQSTILLTTRSEDAAVALGAQVHLLDELSSAESTELLITLLGKERVEKEAEAATQIGDLLHHLPLAVEIVGQLLAARSRRPLVQMAQRLHDVGYRLDLQISDRDVRTSFLVSWEALDEAHQRVFAHLAVFGGRSFTLRALAALLGEGDDVDEDLVWDQLDLLVARSLVKEAGDDRYSQHPLLADFAREQLGDAPEVWSRFAACQLAFAREHREAYDALEPEWDNVMAGMGAAHRLELWETVLAFAEVLGDAWFIRARYSDARQGYAWAVEGADQADNLEMLGHCYARWGDACLEQDDYTSAALYLQKAQTLYEHLEDETALARVHYALGRMAVERSQPAKAATHLALCEELWQQENNHQGLAKVYYQQASLAYDQGKLETAGELCQKVRLLLADTVAQHHLLPTLRLLVDIAIEEEAYDRAQYWCQAATEIATRYQLRPEIAAIHYSQAVIMRRLHQLSSAEHHVALALSLFQQMGDKHFQALAHYEHCRIYALQQQNTLAREQGIKSLRILQEINQVAHIVSVQSFLDTLV